MLLNSFLTNDTRAALLLAAFLLSAFIFIKRDRSYATVCASEFLISAFIYPFISIFIDFETWDDIQLFVFAYALKDFLFIVLLSRIYTPSKFLFMLALFVSMIANWLVLISIHVELYAAYDARPLAMRACIALQLTAMVYTMVRGDDSNDGTGGNRKRLRRLIFDLKGLLCRKTQAKA